MRCRRLFTDNAVRFELADLHPRCNLDPMAPRSRLADRPPSSCRSKSGLIEPIVNYKCMTSDHEKRLRAALARPRTSIRIRAVSLIASWSVVITMPSSTGPGLKSKLARCCGRRKSRVVNVTGA